jgi:DNA adenine methylase
MVTIEQEKTSLSQTIEQIDKYPPTRYMGSKSKLLDNIWDSVKNFKFESVLDLFSGSGTVSYMFKCYGKSVTANDYMAMDAVFAKAMIENSRILLTETDIEKLLAPIENDHFVENKFKGLYFSDEDNEFIDNVRTNIKLIDNEYKRAEAMSALIRACIKKRPRGIFTYTGNRYNDGRRDLQKSFAQQFIEAVHAINDAVFDNNRNNIALWGDSLLLPKQHYDLVYIDPPYFTPKSDNEYVRRYHFVEGLARDWKGVEIQENTKTKKFKSYPTQFSTREGAREALLQIFEKYSDSILLVSYSSNSEPNKDDMVKMISLFKDNVTVIPLDYKYSFGNRQTVMRNEVKEYLFVGW